MTDKKSVVPMFCTPMFAQQCNMLYHLSMIDLAIGFTKASCQPIFAALGNESLIPRARNGFVKQFLEAKHPVTGEPPTHLFFIDADIGFQPQHAADMLMSDFDVVFGAYPKKGLNWQRVLESVISGRATLSQELPQFASDFALNFHDECVNTGKFPAVSRNGCNFMEIKEGSTGFMCIKREVIEKMVEAYPERRYFADVDHNGVGGHVMYDLFYSGIDPMPVDPEKPRYLSEDYGFCRLWQKLGGKCYVYIGAQLTHTGTHVFHGNFSLVFSPNEEDAARP